MAKVFFETHGCSANLAESEMMMGLAEAEGNQIAQNENDADVLVINICTVKGDNNALRHIRRIKVRNPDKKIIVAGCIPKYTIPKIKEIYPKINLVNTYNLRKINDVIESSLNNQSLDAITYNNELKVEFPRFRSNPVIGIIPISSGCISNCTFCSVKLIKGNLKSYPIESILRDIRISLESGCKEIWLTSQDNGCYGFDISTNLPELIKEIIRLDYDFKVRVGMASPQHLIPYLEEFIKVFKSDKIFKFIHLPVQSGNDYVLKDMKRECDVKTFREIVNKLRNEILQLTLSTDVICGFPTESDEHFNDTFKLIEEIKPDVLNISKYQARPFTLASKKAQLRGEILKNRTRKMTKLFNVVALQQNRKWLNWEGQIIIDEIGKNNAFIGRNFAYKPVVVKGNFKLGDIVNVRITDMTSYDLRGELFSNL